MISSLVTLLVAVSLDSGLALGAEAEAQPAAAGCTNQTVHPKGMMSRTQVISKPDLPTIQLVQAAKAKLRQIQTAKSDKSKPQNLAEAAQHLAECISMACPPGVCLEHEGWFYFSGGRSTQFETNFLSGFAVKKGDTAIYSWEEESKKKK